MATSLANGVTIREILQTGLSDSMRIIAGKKSLDRVVTSVNVIDSPEYACFVEEGQLVITSGYIFKDDPKAFADFISLLSDKRAAGLIMNTRKYVKGFSKLIKKAADDRDFPLIEMSENFSNPIILEKIFLTKSDKQIQALQSSTILHQDMVDVVAKGGGIQDLCSLIFQQYKQEIYVLDNLQNIINYAGDRTDEQIKTIINDLRKLNIFEYNNTKTIVYDEDDTQKNVMMVPILVGNWRNGSIITLSISSFSQINQLNFERAATIIALLMSHVNELKEIETRYHNEFLFDLLFGKFSSEKVMQQRAAKLGWDFTRPLALMVFNVNCRDNESEKSRNTERKPLMRKAIEGVLPDFNVKFYIGSVGDDVICFMSGTEKNDANEVHQIIKAAAPRMYDYALSRFRFKIQISTGRFRENPLDLQKCYKEAKNAMSVGQQFSNDNILFMFEEQGLHRLLYNIDPIEIQKTINEFYMPLYEYDNNHGTQLIETVKAYFKLNRNVSKVSKHMFTHYNTILYRIENINKITGIDLKNSDDGLVLLYIAVLLGESKRNRDF